MRVVTATFSDPAARETDIAAAVRLLERLAEDGCAEAAARLAALYGGVWGRGGMEEAERARSCLFLAFTLAGALPEPERAAVVAITRTVVGNLIERHGAAFLDDSICLLAMGGGEGADSRAFSGASISRGDSPARTTPAWGWP